MSEAVNWPVRFQEMVHFIGLTDEDRQLIKASAPIIMRHADRLTSAMYDHFLEYPQARKFFVDDHDEPDVKRIESNKQTMISWLRATTTAASNEGFVRYLVGTSQMHYNTPIHRPPLSPVAPRYILGAVACYQTLIADLMLQHVADAAQALRSSVAWNKWLMIELELLLASYLKHNE